MTESLWKATAATPSYPALQGAVTADVIVVGGGLTGVTAAVLLAREGRRVALVEAQQLGSGVTGGTTAHITAILDTRYHTIQSDFGEEGARLAAQSHTAAIEQIATFIREYNIDCDFRRVPGFLYTERQDDVDMLRQEYETMRALGLPATLVNTLDLPFPITLGIRVEDQAQFHPLKYLAALANVAAQHGCSIYENSKVTKIEDNDDGVRVETEQGSVSASAVFMATHVPPGINIVDTEVAPYRSYAIACKTDEVYPIGLFWDTEDPYNYTRIQEHDGERWLIVGGKDHKTGQSDNTDVPFQELAQYAHDHYHTTSVDYRWSAQVYEPSDGLAYIGKSPGAKNYYYATGYSGNGITYSNVAARLITDLIVGRYNPYADVYSPSRIKPAAAAVDYIKENVNVAARFIGDRLKTEAESYADIVRGEGKIMRVDGQQVAAYRAEDGTLHLLSPICPHMKCIVNWNIAEQTWDCPCHGGRFRPTGEWIEGPPLHGLERLDTKIASSGQE